MNPNRKLACLTMDVESDLRSPIPHIELFSNPEHFDRFKGLLNSEEVPVTAFLVTKLLHQLPEVIETVSNQIPIDFEIHSYSHDQQAADSAQEIERSVKVFESFFCKNPKGYRAPNGLISEKGLHRLSEAGFNYDSSIFPSIRMDEYGYNHLSMPVEPFIFSSPKPIVEIPLGVISKIRLVVSISYIKLLGFGTYQALMRLFGLPDTLVLLCHPYDFTISHCLPNIKGWKKFAHARNGSNSLSILEKLIRNLKNRGYQFVSMDEIVRQIDISSLVKIDPSSIK